MRPEQRPGVIYTELKFRLDLICLLRLIRFSQTIFCESHNDIDKRRVVQRKMLIIMTACGCEVLNYSLYFKVREKWKNG